MTHRTKSLRPFHGGQAVQHRQHPSLATPLSKHAAPRQILVSDMLQPGHLRPLIAPADSFLSLSTYPSFSTSHFHFVSFHNHKLQLSSLLAFPYPNLVMNFPCPIFVTSLVRFPAQLVVYIRHLETLTPTPAFPLMSSSTLESRRPKTELGLLKLWWILTGHVPFSLMRSCSVSFVFHFLGIHCRTPAPSARFAVFVSRKHFKSFNKTPPSLAFSLPASYTISLNANIDIDANIVINTNAVTVTVTVTNNQQPRNQQPTTNTDNRHQ